MKTKVVQVGNDEKCEKEKEERRKKKEEWRCRGRGGIFTIHVGQQQEVTTAGLSTRKIDTPLSCDHAELQFTRG